MKPLLAFEGRLVCARHYEQIIEESNLVDDGGFSRFCVMLNDFNGLRERFKVFIIFVKQNKLSVPPVYFVGAVNA